MYAAPVGSSRRSTIEKVGKDGFVAKPIGAGPYKLVNQEPGTRLDFEAFEGYYAPVHVKQFTIVSAPDAATRVAMVERGEADIVYGLSGELVPRIQRSKTVMLAPVLSGNFWLWFPGFQDPKNPFHDKRVRQAVSLAIDREAINQAECAGLGEVDGNWINDDVEYAIEWPKWEHECRESQSASRRGRPPERLRIRLADAGPALFFARRACALATSGHRHPRQTADARARRLQQAAAERNGEWPGLNIVFSGARIGASWANWYESLFKCGGQLGADAICVKDLDAKFERYIATRTMRPSASSSPRKSSAKYSKTTISCRCSVTLS